jgi:hypothetical protein
MGTYLMDRTSRSITKWQSRFKAVRVEIIPEPAREFCRAHAISAQGAPSSGQSQPKQKDGGA